MIIANLLVFNRCQKYHSKQGWMENGGWEYNDIFKPTLLEEGWIKLRSDRAIFHLLSTQDSTQPILIQQRRLVITVYISLAQYILDFFSSKVKIKERWYLEYFRFWQSVFCSVFEIIDLQTRSTLILLCSQKNEFHRRHFHPTQLKQRF